MVLLIVSFVVQKFLSLIKFHLFIFAFVAIAFDVISQKLLSRQMSRSFFPLFSSRCFIVSGLMLKSHIYFELIFMDGVKQEYNFHLCHTDIQFFQNNLLKILFLFIEYSWLFVN